MPARGRPLKAPKSTPVPTSGLLSLLKEEETQSSSTEEEHAAYSPAETDETPSPLSAATSTPLSAGTQSSKEKRSFERGGITLNDMYTALPYEMLVFDKAIAGELDAFQPYRPLVNDKRFPPIDVWVVYPPRESGKADLRLVPCKDQVLYIFKVYSTNLNCS